MAECTPREALWKLRYDYPRRRRDEGDDTLSTEELVRLVGLLDDKHAYEAWCGPNWAVYEQETPIVHDIARSGDGPRVVAVLKAFVERIKDFEITPDVADYSGAGVLHYAAMNPTGAVIIEQLTECQVDMFDNDGETPLMRACTSDKYLENLKALHKRGANIWHAAPPCPRACCRGQEMEPALLVALKSKSLECARYLVDQGALRASRERLELYREEATKAGPEFEALIYPQKKQK